MAGGSRYVATAVAVAVLVTASAVVATATSVTSNSASPGGYRADDYADGHALAILPPGAHGLVDPAQAVSFETTGARPTASDDQLHKYATLLYGAEGLTDAQLPTYFDDESFGAAPGHVG